MDMKASPGKSSDLFPVEEVGGVYYTVLYGVISFLLILVAFLLVYVACSKRYRLNWFEKNLLENAAETSELTNSQDALINVSGDGERRGSRAFPRGASDDKFWIPVGKASKSGALDPLESSGDDSDTPGSPNTSRGSKTSLTAESLKTEDGSTAVQPIARNEKQVVLANIPAKPLISMNTKLDFTKIDTTLYEEANEPNFEPVNEEKGQILLSLSYDASGGMLSISLKEAQNLIPKDLSDSADPYAKIRLLPDKGNVWQTRIHKKTLNPVFDEDFVFEVQAMSLSRRTLEIILYDFDAYARHQSIAGLKLPLAEFDLTEKITIWKPLGPVSEQDEKAELGDLLVSLSYLPSAERLTVVIVKARNLRIVDENRLTSDPFVKVILLQGGKRLKKKKSSIHRSTLNPTFNERFTFDVGKETLSKCCLDFCVYHDAKMGPCELLGRALVGPTSSCRPEDREFFSEILNNKAANAKWLILSDPR